MLRIGDPAPSFHLASTSGQDVKLEDFRGQKVVLYFYPKDETPGCTKEACDFRDNIERVRATGAVVLGVSPDSIESHHDFRAHHGLSFDLLSDPEHRVAEDFGAYGEKILYGNPTMGIIRSTFVIDELGYVDAIWSPVTVDGHVDQVIEFLGGGAVPLPSKPAGVAAPPKKASAPKPAAPKPQAPKKAAPKKTAAPKKPAKKGTGKAAKKTAKKAVKKVAKKVAKKPIKKLVKKVAKKATKKAAKKAVKRPVKKPVKKVAKKAARPALKKTAKKAAKKSKKR